MLKLKRIIALITVAMFVFSFAAPATAATTTAAVSKSAIGADVKGTKYEEDAKKLISLGIINGFEDGTVRPDETVTRAQFAAIVAQELGIASGVGQATTKFKDVPSSHWASGVINLAVGRGIIVGYPDGTFKPDAPVSYAEAYAMLVQMLGYGPALKGAAWPSGVLAKAASLGVSKSVSGAADTAMKRGDVIIAASNSLDVDIMEQDEWGDNNVYKAKEDKTILSEVFDIDVHDKENSSDNKKNIDTVSSVSRFDLGSLKGNEINLKTNSGKTYTVSDVFDANQYIGQQVKYWVDEDDKKIYYIGSADNETVLNDTVKEWNVSDNKIKLDKKDKSYSFVSGSDLTLKNVYVNTSEVDADDFVDDLAADSYKDADVKVVLDSNDKVKSLVITDFYASDAKTGVIEEINSDDNIVTYYDQEGSETELDLDDADYVVVRNGVNGGLSDLAKGDVLNVLEGDTDEYFIYATDNKVKGEVSKIVASEQDNVAKYELYISGTKYKTANAEISFSDDDNENVSAVTSSDLDDLDGKTATLYLNAQGKVAHIVTGDATESSKLYGVLERTPYEYNADEIKLILVNQSNSKLTFTFEPDDVKLNGTDDLDASDWTDLTVTQGNPVFVEYKLNSSGNLTEIKTAISNLRDIDSGSTIDIDDNAIDLDGGSYKITDKTVIWDATGWDAPKVKDLKTVSWSALDDKKVQGFAKVNGSNVDYIVVKHSDKTLGSNAKYGVITGFGTKSGDSTVYILDGDGKEVSYINDNTASGASDYVYGAATNRVLTKGDFVYYTLNADGTEIDDITTLAYKNANSKAFDTTDDDVALDSVKTVRVTKGGSSSIKGYVVNDITGADTGSEKQWVFNSSTKFFDIHDNSKLKAGKAPATGDFVVLVDTDDDSSSIDYVLIVRD